MAHDKSNDLALELMLKDLEDLEDRQKGKQVAGEYSDLEIAVNCMRDDILAAQTSIQDRVLALSTSTAVANDQNALASFRNDENIAEQDRRYALSLSDPTLDPPDTPAPTEMPPTEENKDVVAMILRDLMSRMHIDDDPPNGEGSSMPSSRTSGAMKECVSCLEKFHTTIFRGSCGHEFCRDCLKQMFLGATKDEELYPPRCCGNVVPPGVAMRVLHYQELREFCEKAIEWTAKERLYCADPTCSKFIPAFAIHDEIGTCPACHQDTHVTCRSFAHPGIDCPMDESLHGMLEMAEGENWKRCFRCRNMVELSQGCHHITCR